MQARSSDERASEHYFFHDIDHSTVHVPLEIFMSIRSHWRKEKMHEVKSADYYVIELVIAGSMRFMQAGREHIVNPGGVFMPKKGMHYAYKTGPAGYVLKRALLMRGPYVDEFLSYTGFDGADVIQLPMAALVKVKRYMRECDSLMMKEPPGFVLDLASVGMRLLLEIRNHTKVPVPEAIDASIRYMQKNCDRNVVSEELAEVAKLSVPHFNRLFRKATGRSPMDYFLTLRIGRAKRLLESTSMRIKEIAFQLGYDNPLYFTTIFTRRESMSPHAYRQKYSGVHRH